MDPQLGRWHVVDALAESYMSTSPYAYTANDPINHIDILGLAQHGTHDAPQQRAFYWRNVRGQPRYGDDRDFIYRDNGWGGLFGWTYRTPTILNPYSYNEHSGQTVNHKGQTVDRQEVIDYYQDNYAGYFENYTLKWRDKKKKSSFDPNAPGKPILLTDDLEAVIVPYGEYYYETVYDFKMKPGSFLAWLASFNIVDNGVSLYVEGYNFNHGDSRVSRNPNVQQWNVTGLIAVFGGIRGSFLQLLYNTFNYEDPAWKIITMPYSIDTVVIPDYSFYIDTAKFYQMNDGTVSRVLMFGGTVNDSSNYRNIFDDYFGN